MHLNYTNVQDFNAHSIVNYCYDEGALYYYSAFKNTSHLIVFEPSTFKAVNSILLNINVNYGIAPKVDQNFIFITTADGNIIPVDKFSLIKGKVIHLGQMVATEQPKTNSDNIFSLCGLPLSFDKDKNAYNFVICCNDIKTGSKTFQSRIFKDHIMYDIQNDSIFVSDKRELTKHTLHFSPLKSIICTYKPTRMNAYKNHIYTFSNSGSVECFDNELNPVFKLLCEPTKFVPVFIGDSIFWPCNNKIYSIDINKGDIHNSAVIDLDIVSDVVTINDKISWMNSNRTVVSYDGNKVVELCKFPTQTKNIAVIQNYIMGISQNQFLKYEQH